MFEGKIVKKIKNHEKLVIAELEFLINNAECEVVRIKDISIIYVYGKYWAVRWPLYDQYLDEMEKLEEIKTTWKMK